MKEKFLNIFLFLISLSFIGAGVVLMFFNHIDLLAILHKNFNLIFNNEKLSNFFISFFGSFIFGWGIFFFLFTILAVMDLKKNYVHGFIFWAFTFWAVSAGVVSYLFDYKFLMILISIIYGVIFLPFFLSIPLKSSNYINKQQDQQKNTF